MWIPFHDIDLKLLANSNLVKEYVVDIYNKHAMLKKKKNHEYYSNVLWVINIDMDIDICKNQNKN